jgi:hypothetical protein
LQDGRELRGQTDQLSKLSKRRITITSELHPERPWQLSTRLDIEQQPANLHVIKLWRVCAGLESREQQTESREQQTESREQQTDSREQQTESRKQQTDSRKQRAESREERAERAEREQIVQRTLGWSRAIA